LFTKTFPIYLLLAPPTNINLQRPKILQGRLHWDTGYGSSGELLYHRLQLIGHSKLDNKHLLVVAILVTCQFWL